MKRLLTAGMRVFDERGYQAARVDDIVKAAKTSHGTFYLYFANKEDLFRVLAQDCLAAIDALADEVDVIDAGAAGRAALRTWIEHFVRAYREFGPVIRTWAEAQVDNRELNRLGGAAMDRLTARLAEQIARARADGTDPQQGAIASVAMVERFNFYVLSDQVTISDDVLRDTLTDIAHAGAFGGRLGAS